MLTLARHCATYYVLNINGKLTTANLHPCALNHCDTPLHGKVYGIHSFVHSLIHSFITNTQLAIQILQSDLACLSCLAGACSSTCAVCRHVSTQGDFWYLFRPCSTAQPSSGTTFSTCGQNLSNQSPATSSATARSRSPPRKLQTFGKDCKAVIFLSFGAPKLGQGYINERTFEIQNPHTAASAFEANKTVAYCLAYNRLVQFERTSRMHGGVQSACKTL